MQIRVLARATNFVILTLRLGALRLAQDCATRGRKEWTKFAGP